MTRAMLLCAGRGSRLASLSSDCPKPLLPVCNIPILRYGIANLVGHGICDIVINLHYQGDQIATELGDGADMGARIQYSWEESMLGTGGGLKKALPLLDPDGTDEPFLCLNGKLIFDLEIRALLEFYGQTESLGTMVVKYVGPDNPWGAVDVHCEEGQWRVHNILGKGEYMFCGVHITRPSVVARLPEGEACMVRQGYLPWIQDGQKVSAYVHEKGYFAEHSTPERYLQSNIDLLQGTALSHPPSTSLLSDLSDSSTKIHPSTQLVHPVSIAEDVSIGAHCKIGPNVVIGQGAVVSEGSSLKNCVLWRQVRVSGSYDGYIFTAKDDLRAEGW